MANFNTLIKRKQYLWLVLILVSGACAIAGGMYLSDLNLSSEEEAPVQGEPAPDMTGVVDSQFNSKVEQHATTEMQATAADLNKRFGALQGEVDLLSKARSADQIRIDKLSNENVAMQEQLKTLGVKPAVSGGEPAPSPPSPPPGPEGEPQPTNFPAQSGGAVPPPTAFYPGNGTVQAPQVSYQSVPVPNQIQRKTFSYDRGKKTKSLPYIPSGSFAKSKLIEGADANASVDRPWNPGAITGGRVWADPIPVVSPEAAGTDIPLPPEVLAQRAAEEAQRQNMEKQAEQTAREVAGDGRKAGESEDRVKEVIGDVIRGLEREKPGEEKMTLPDDPQTRKQEAAVQQVAQESLQRERLQQMERDMVRDLNREKTLGGD